ncbi:hypothetical protein VTN00DRAFT_7400 [Thermoascus crustaceus]|uniref:uncharacterized protein n=1 Tax=Thermoascus crustaceus TaxID=5088 RepID=UPI003744629C
MPALDVLNLLNLEQNEGSNFPGTLNVLFAGILREYTKHREDAGLAAGDLPRTVQFSLIPEQILRSLRDNILPLVEDVCTKFESLEDSTRHVRKTWKFGSRLLHLVLTKEQWCRLRQFLKVPEGLSVGEAQRIRKSTVLAPHRKDYLERTFYQKKPGWRVCAMKFREYGILLPFGASQKNFDTPNPKTLNTFGTLLKPKLQNVHATRLCLFMNALEETCTEFDTVLSLRDDTPRLERYLSLTRHNFPDRGADLIRIAFAAKMFRDFETLFNQYMSEHEFTKISREAGLEIKTKNTIVSRPFPMQLRHNASQYEFDLLQALGSKRHVEWRRVDIGTGTVRRSADAASDYSMVIFIVVAAISILVLFLFTAFMILSWPESLINSL